MKDIKITTTRDNTQYILRPRFSGGYEMFDQLGHLSFGHRTQAEFDTWVKDGIWTVETFPAPDAFTFKAGSGTRVYTAKRLGGAGSSHEFRVTWDGYVSIEYGVPYSRADVENALTKRQWTILAVLKEEPKTVLVEGCNWVEEGAAKEPTVTLFLHYVGRKEKVVEAHRLPSGDWKVDWTAFFTVHYSNEQVQEFIKAGTWVVVGVR